jgi:hypothetical protein
MADYSLTSSAAIPSDDATLENYTAGATIAAGQPVYADATALDAKRKGKAKLADANASAATATVIGIAATSASAGQPVRVITEDDDYTHGLTGVTAGDIIILSATAGGLAPASDMATGMRPCVVMLATSSTKAQLVFANGSAAKP